MSGCLNLTKYCVGLVAFLSLGLACADTHYLAMVDGGSTGSRLYLYQYDPDVPTTLKLPTLMGSTKVSPGIATLSPSAVSSYLTPFFNLIHQDVPAGKTVDFYFLATAGMRLLSYDQQQAIYTALDTAVKNETGINPVKIQTIPGQMEGVFDWIALNQLLNTLGQPAANTVGVMDMGGASTEIAFAGQNMDLNDSVSFTLDNQTYTLYSHSYLGLGENQAQSEYMNAAECYPVAYPLPNDQPGVGDFGLCQKHVEALVNNVQNVAAVQSFIPANTQMPFYGISGYAYTNTLKIFNLGSQLSVNQLTKTASSACAQTWTVLNQQDPSDPYLYSACFDAALITEMLTSYGFDPNQIITATNTAGSSQQTIDWTLGAVIYYLNVQGVEAF